MNSSSGNSDSSGTITVGFAGTEGGWFVKTISALSFSLNETVRVGTCPLGVCGGDSNTRDDRGELLGS